MKRWEKSFSLGGTALFEGMGYGKLFFLDPAEITIPQLSLSTHEVEREVKRYQQAILSSRKDLHRFLLREKESSTREILSSQVELLEDPSLTTEIEENIRGYQKNSEAALAAFVCEYEKKLSTVENIFMKDRLLDVKDIAQRILRNLRSIEQRRKSSIPYGAIVVAKEMTPSVAAEMHASRIKGVITEFGGVTSHTAVILSSKGIPSLVNIEVEALLPYIGKEAILDGKREKLFVNPSKKMIVDYFTVSKEIAQKAKEEEKNYLCGVTTRDFYPIKVLANVDHMDDIDLARRYGAEGIGLIRTEFFFFHTYLDAVTEEEQFRLYSKVLSMVGELPVTFRMFDAGGDKKPFKEKSIEPNPALGCRAIRVLFDHPQIFLRQLKALFFAHANRHARILLPFVSSFEEIRKAKKIVERALSCLKEEGKGVPSHIEIGVMVEVPAMVIMIDLLVKEVDFIAIGTNDLTQYALAADRSTREAHSFYLPFHPAVMRMIYQVTSTVRSFPIPLSLCGEIVSNPLAIPLLVGLGVRELSCAPRFIVKVRKIIEKTSFAEAKEMAQRVLSMKSATQVEKCVRAHDATL